MLSALCCMLNCSLLNPMFPFKDGYELISEALNLLNNVYGAMHPEIAQVCLLL